MKRVLAPILSFVLIWINGPAVVWAAGAKIRGPEILRSDTASPSKGTPVTVGQIGDSSLAPLGSATPESLDLASPSELSDTLTEPLELGEPAANVDEIAEPPQVSVRASPVPEGSGEASRGATESSREQSRLAGPSRESEDTASPAEKPLAKEFKHRSALIQSLRKDGASAEQVEAGLRDLYSEQWFGEILREMPVSLKSQALGRPYLQHRKDIGKWIIREHGPMRTFNQAHPRLPGILAYHGPQHSFGRGQFTAVFFSSSELFHNLIPRSVYFSADRREAAIESAVDHDWHPGRKPGTPPRVPDTIEHFRQGFIQRFHKRKLLWTAKALRDWYHRQRMKLLIKEAIIWRSEYPFGFDHPNPAYNGTSPLARYERPLQRLKARSETDLDFVLYWAPFFSEYVDKMGPYATDPFVQVMGSFLGLINERRSEGAPESELLKMLVSTTKFLESLGRPESFKHDKELAKLFGIENFEMPSREQVFTALHPRFGLRFESNSAGFKTFEGVLKESFKDALEGKRSPANALGDRETLKRAVLAGIIAADDYLRANVQPNRR